MEYIALVSALTHRESSNAPEAEAVVKIRTLNILIFQMETIPLVSHRPERNSFKRVVRERLPEDVPDKIETVADIPAR